MEIVITEGIKTKIKCIGYRITSAFPHLSSGHSIDKHMQRDYN